MKTFLLILLVSLLIPLLALPTFAQEPTRIKCTFTDARTARDKGFKDVSMEEKLVTFVCEKNILVQFPNDEWSEAWTRQRTASAQPTREFWLEKVKDGWEFVFVPLPPCEKAVGYNRAPVNCKP